MSHSSVRSFLLCVGCAAGIGLATAPVQAQTAPSTKPVAKPAAKPAAKPDAKPENKTLGGKGTASGKLMTRDELRQCLARLDQINVDTKSLEERRNALNAERDELLKIADALKVEREAVDRRLVAVRDWEAQVRAHAQEVEAFNLKAATLKDAPRSRQEALEKELNAEAERLNAKRAVLAADEATVVPGYKTAASAFNAKAEARDARASEWNARNGQVNETALKYDEARATWLSECANRPYREDDEIAIKQGR